jgi:hypothetical protein
MLTVIAVAAQADDLTTYTTLTGRCVAVVTLGAAVDPARCAGRVVNVAFPSGRLGFMFPLNRSGEPKPVLFSFFGDAANRMHPDGVTAILPIDHVYFTVQGSTDDLPAAGSCSSADPHNGSPVRISCSADTARGRFAGEFVGDGTLPEASQLR